MDHQLGQASSRLVMVRLPAIILQRRIVPNNVSRQQRVDILDTHWLEILIFMIGEQAEVLHAKYSFEQLGSHEQTPAQVHASKVNGAVVNLRAKGDKLGVSE